jgi:hypothetical protein
LEIAMTDALVKPPWHIWLIGVIAVLFNSIGVFDFVMSMAQGVKYLASAGMTPDQIAHYQAMPSWMTVVWAVGVFGAFLASILLLLRSKLAVPVASGISHQPPLHLCPHGRRRRHGSADGGHERRYRRAAGFLRLVLTVDGRARRASLT